MNNAAILTILTERQHRRLSDIIKRIRKYSSSTKDIQKYRTYWNTKLGYTPTEELLFATNHLIRNSQHNEAYDKLIVAIENYQSQCWHQLKCKCKNVNRYQDRWLHVKQRYKDQFREEFESNGLMSVEQQVEMMKAILNDEPIPIEPVKTNKSVKKNVVQHHRRDMIYKTVRVKTLKIVKMIKNILNWFNNLFRK